MLIIIMVAVAGVALNFVRLWLFVSTTGGRAKASRIAELNSHLSFDERLAERLRAMEQERATDSHGSDPAVSTPPLESGEPPHFTPPAAAGMPRGFGRRGL